MGSAKDQDELDMFSHLLALVDDFESPGAIKFFKSSESRNLESAARKVIESGREGIKDLEPVKVSKVIFAALLLGGDTF